MYLMWKKNIFKYNLLIKLIYQMLQQLIAGDDRAGK